MALIALAVIASVRFFGQTVEAKFRDQSARVDDLGGGAAAGGGSALPDRGPVPGHTPGTTTPGSGASHTPGTTTPGRGGDHSGGAPETTAGPAPGAGEPAEPTFRPGERGPRTDPDDSPFIDGVYAPFGLDEEGNPRAPYGTDMQGNPRDPTCKGWGLTDWQKGAIGSCADKAHLAPTHAEATKRGAKLAGIIAAIEGGPVSGAIAALMGIHAAVVGDDTTKDLVDVLIGVLAGEAGEAIGLPRGPKIAWDLIWDQIIDRLPDEPRIGGQQGEQGGGQQQGEQGGGQQGGESQQGGGE